MSGGGPGGVLAHGTGQGHELPVSPFYAYAGAFAALLISFLALGLLWERSRLRGDTAGRPLPDALRRAADAPAARLLPRVLGLAAYLYTLAAALLGSDAAPRLLHAVLWAGLVPASLLLGPVWRRLDPLRTLHALACRALGRDPATGIGGRREVPEGLGHWPAAAGLLGYAWTELASPEPQSPATVAVFVLAYSAVQLAGAACWGSGWFDRCDPFTVHSGLLGSLAPVGRRPADGRPVLRLPLHGLDTVRPRPGLTATVCVLLAATAYDGLTLTGPPSWLPAGTTAARTLGLLTTVAVVALAMVAATSAARLFAAGPEHRPGEAQFAHSLVPIAAGYLIAHYLEMLLTEAPRAVGAPAVALPAAALATVQVGAIVAGHLGGVVAAHDRAVRLFPPHRAVAGQIPLLILMIGYTLAGLALLMSG
ncbi:hypothetical protein [Streptomyces aidingensis]|uniref:Uncharacterized protein n=1 Tax=Streptomyces aidingensis TaxID=910347 RepID=A0A1I1U732_9ACTN|nr:hypothetical protein [Streptomyces aidingensis]SFD66666.1 hypothetical protein SAMN05421773_12323 [Streptomyces aidingensis]